MFWDTLSHLCKQCLTSCMLRNSNFCLISDKLNFVSFFCFSYSNFWYGSRKIKIARPNSQEVARDTKCLSANKHTDQSIFFFGGASTSPHFFHGAYVRGVAHVVVYSCILISFRRASILGVGWCTVRASQERQPDPARRLAVTRLRCTSMPLRCLLAEII